VKAIYPRDVPQSVPLFRREDSKGRMEYRPRYQDLVCRECGKLDELVALSRGIDEDISFSIIRDMCLSFENLYIVSDRLRYIVTEIKGSDVTFVPFPSAPGYYVIMPHCLIRPQEGDTAFRLLRKCGECGRYGEIIWGKGVPHIMISAPLGAVCLESSLGIMPILFATDEVARLLKNTRPKLNGFILAPLGRPPGLPELPIPGG